MDTNVNFKAGLLVFILICPQPYTYAEPPYHALPSNGQVVAGQSSIHRQGNQLNINQGTQKAIINWQDYNIGGGAAVNYKQPNAGAVSFNRVLSANPTEISGKLNANGQVWLINPNGVVFGKSAQVNVGGLAASTLNIKDENFLKAKKPQFNGDGKGSVVNEGRITAKKGGYVALLAPEVRNEGVVSAKQGTVAMAAGEKITLDFNGDKLINVQVEPSKIKALVENKRLIITDGGQVLMAASAADNLQTSVINNSGKIEASSMTSDGGVIRLSGAQTVLNSGEISAKSTAGKGGRVEMLGTNVGLMDKGKVDVSGKAGGGTILVGGDYQGKNPSFQNAQKTYISQNAKLIADAKVKGNGGKVIAWADDITRYHGSISAKGGKLGGNGGFAEVSGKRLLEFNGKADLSANKGKGGNILLDPLNITITNTAASNTTGFAPPGDTTEAFADDAGLTSNINVTPGTGSFAGVTAGSTITLQATNDITVSNAFNIASSTGSANNNLVLQANNNININAAVTGSGTGSLGMTADADSSGAGNLSINAALTTANAAINLSGVGVSSNSLGDINSNGGTVTVTNTGSTNTNLAGAISGAGTTFTKNGAGPITFTGANAYTGGTNINSGTLTSGGHIPNSSPVTVAGGATLTLNVADIVGSLAGAGNVVLNGALTAGGNNSDTTFSGVMSGPSNFTKQGSGIMSLSGANTYTGTTTISAGTLVADNASALGSTSGSTTISSGATLNINNVAIGNEAISVAGSGIGGNGALTGTGSASLAGTVTQTAASALGTTNAASSLTLGGIYNGATTTTITGAGNLTATNAANNFTTVNVNNAGNVTLRDTNALALDTANVLGNFNLQTNGAITQTGAGSVSVGGATTLAAGAGNDITLNNATNNFNTLGITNGRDVNITDANALTVNASSPRTLIARTLTNDLSLNGNITATGTGSGTSITLASAGNFINSGNFGLTPGTSSRWLVYSTNPTTDTRGAGLLSAYNLKQYNTSYPGTVLGTGNGFIYSVSPTITASLGGTATKVYDGTTTAPIAGLAFNQSGAIDGDTVTLSGLTSATYDNKNAGTGKTVTANALSITGVGNGGKTVFGYTLASPTVNGAVGAITPAALSLNAVSDTKTYDGTTTSSGVVATGGLVGGDTVAGLSQSFATKDALGANGSALNVNAGFTVNDGNGGNNYAVSQNSSVGTVTPRPITVAAATDSKPYDGTASSAGAPTVAAGSIVTGDTGNFSQSFDNKNAGAGKTLTASGTVSDGNGGGNYAVSFAPNITGVVTPANLALNAVGDTKTYDGTTTSSGVVATGGLVGGDTVAGLSQSFATKNALGTNGSTLNVNVGFTVNDGNGGGNYSVSQNSATGTITSAALTITANDRNKTYGQQVAFTGNEFTSSGLVAGETIGTANLASTGTASFADVAHGPYDINASNATGGTFDADNYAITYNHGSLSVDRAPLVITSNDARKFQGSPNPAFSGSFSGFVNGEDSSVLNGALRFSTPAETGSLPGFYFIRPFAVTADNYAISFIDGTLAVLAQINPPPTPNPSPNPNPRPNPNPGISPLAILSGTVTRPEQSVQPCRMAASSKAMLTGMDEFGLDDMYYKSTTTQPQVGGVVANALVKPSCYKL